MIRHDKCGSGILNRWTDAVTANFATHVKTAGRWDILYAETCIRKIPDAVMMFIMAGGDSVILEMFVNVKSFLQMLSVRTRLSKSGIGIPEYAKMLFKSIGKDR